MHKLVLIPLFVVALGACGGNRNATSSPAQADNRSLYERLGKSEGIAAVVKRFVEVTGSDPRISVFFINADKPRLEAMMVEHICELTGGPCKYTGKSMKESHTGMKVKADHFAAFMEDLGKTLDEFKVPAREKSEVLGAFESLRSDVVEP